MEKKNKIVIAASLLAVVAVGGVAVGTTTALFTREAKSNIHVVAGKLDVGFYVNKIVVDRLKSDGTIDKNVEMPLNTLYSEYYVADKGVDLVKYEGNSFEVDNAFPSMEATVTYLIENNSNIAVNVSVVDVAKGTFADSTEDTPHTMDDATCKTTFHIENSWTDGTMIKAHDKATYTLKVVFDEELGNDYELFDLVIDSQITATQVSADHSN